MKESVFWIICCTTNYTISLNNVISFVQQPTHSDQSWIYCHNVKNIFCEVQQVITLCLTLPVSIAKSEWSFFALQRLKSWLRLAWLNNNLHICPWCTSTSIIWQTMKTSSVLWWKNSERKPLNGNVHLALTYNTMHQAYQGKSK